MAKATGVGGRDLLAKVEKLVPGITEKIKLTQALEHIEKLKDTRGGGALRSAEVLGSAAAGFSKGGILGAIGAGLSSYVLTNPSVVLSALETYGRIGDFIEGVTTKALDAISQKVKDKTPLDPHEENVVRDAIDKQMRGTGQPKMLPAEGTPTKPPPIIGSVPGKMPQGLGYKQLATDPNTYFEPQAKSVGTTSSSASTPETATPKATDLLTTAQAQDKLHIVTNVKGQKFLTADGTTPVRITSDRAWVLKRKYGIKSTPLTAK